MSLLSDAVRREAFAEASRSRGEFYECLTARRDELFELVDAVLCADGAVKSPVDLTLLREHRRGHGAMYGGLNRGRIDVGKVRAMLAVGAEENHPRAARIRAGCLITVTTRSRNPR
ncbi:transposase [Streptomyces sp. 067-1]|uniref:transposase n=1 Tax=Streptomyces sp. 067-1 TaxID=2789269 RepID=UPI0039F6307F